MISPKVQWLIAPDLNQSEPLLLFSACDSRYFDYAVSLIASVDLFSPGFCFVLHLINPEQTCLDRALQLAKLLKFTRLAVSSEHIDLSALEEEQKRAYYASARFPQIAKLLHQCHSPLLSLDADSLVVNPIDLDFSNKADAEVIIIRRNLKEEMSEHLSVATGSIWLKPTESVRQFMDQVAGQIDVRLQNKSLKWFVDQVVFYQQMKAMEKKVRFYNLKRKYADWDFHENSIVWAGKGNRKVYDLRFFLLQAMLSDDIRRRTFANQFSANLLAAEDDLTLSNWFHSRLEIARKSVTRISLFIPRLDLPWKRVGDPVAFPPLLTDDVIDLRLHWKAFSIRLANAIERAGVPVDIVELPAWEINRKAIDASGAALALVPHRCRLDFEDGMTPVMFYMQEFFRWVFVINKRGWSAASSAYPVDIESLPETGGGSFEVYRQRLHEGTLNSKFVQPLRRNCAQLIAEGSIPSRRSLFGLRQSRSYIFLPLQIPHDQSIQYFSDLTEQAVVEVVIEWARQRGIIVVMKPHPANRKSMAPFQALTDGHTVYWSEAHVYDLIANATAVYTVNSGVGFEALLHVKPVVTFGKVEYDCVSFCASPDNLDAAWAYCLNADPKALESRYRRFINWFLGDYAVDMSQPERASVKLKELAADIVAQARTPTIRAAR